MTFAVEYLRGLVSAGNHLDRSQVEYPPHPARLFSALVSAAYANGEASERSLSALRWLEQQPAPAIAAPEAALRDVVGYWVPPNYASSRHGEENFRNPCPDLRPKRLRSFPAANVDTPVAFVYATDACEDTRAELARLAATVTYLGRADSPVKIELKDEAVSPNLIPDERGLAQLRVPYPGRLSELQQAYRQGKRALLSRMQGYRPADRSTARPGPLGQLVTFGLNERFPMEWTLTLAESLRAAVMSLADRHGLMTDLLHGHSRAPHCAFLALPDVGHRFAKGHIIGLGVALPRDGNAAEAEKVYRTLSSLDAVTVGGRKLELHRRQALALSPQLWSRPSQRWMTATPVLLDRYPKRQNEAEIICESCDRLGLLPPRKIRCSVHSSLKGVPRVHDFRLHRDGKHRRPALHVELEFDSNVAGPILIGAGRFFGLGLMRPVCED